MQNYDGGVVADEATGRPLMGRNVKVFDEETDAPVQVYREGIPVNLVTGAHGLIPQFQTEDSTRRVRLEVGPVRLRQWSQEMIESAAAVATANLVTEAELAEALEDFDSFVGIPIFATLAEAEAWEAANPGKTALTLEPSTPDTTAPTPGVLSVTPAHNSAALSVSGATDDRAVTGYAFQVGTSGAWSAWQSSPSFTATGLTVSTAYTFRHKVKDAAGNETLGTAVTATTTAKPPLQAGDVMTSDAYTLYADGSLVNGKFTDATLGGEQQTYGVTVNADGAVYQGGALSWAKRAIVNLPLAREDKEVSLTVKALSTTTDKFYITLRNSGSLSTRFIFDSNGKAETLLQGPAGNIGGPSRPAGTVKAGSQITFGVKGDTGYFIIDGVRTDIPSLQGNTGGILQIDNGTGGAIDNLVVKAL